MSALRRPDAAARRPGLSPRRCGLIVALAALSPALALAQASGATGNAAGIQVERLDPNRFGPPSVESEDQDQIPNFDQAPSFDQAPNFEQATPADPGVTQPDATAPGDRPAWAPVGPDGQPLEFERRAPPQPPTTEMAGARLKLLDKMTGAVREVDMAAGQTVDVARLEITLDACRAPESEADAYAYLRIRDLREADPRFAGWMFASSPALSALDHARYDVWVLSCSAKAPVASAGSE